MALRLAVLITVALMAVSGGSAAAATLPPGATDGVRASFSGTELTISFAGPAASILEGLRGARPMVECQSHPPAGLLLRVTLVGSTGVAADRVAAGDHVIRARMDRGSYDVCQVEAPSGPNRVRARVAVTTRGAVWLDELVHVTRLYGAMRPLRGSGRPYPSIDALVAQSGGVVVGLSGPDAAPAPGTVGYWSDSAGRMVFATTSTAGRRLFVEDQGAGMLRSNVLDYDGDVPDDERSTVDVRPIDDREKGVKPVASPRGGPVGPDDGVRTVVSRGRAVIRFTGRSARVARRLAGRRVALRCVPAAPTLTLTAAQPWRHHDRVIRMPRRAAQLVVAVRADDDLCALSDNGAAQATIVLGRRGRVALDDLNAVAALLQAMEPEQRSADRPTRYPSASTWARREHLAVLATPQASPPRGRVGVFSDGGRHAALVALSRSGHRFVSEDEGDGILRTNTFGVLGWALFF